MPELLPSAAEMTGEILVDDKSELIAKVTADRSFYEGLHAHIKHARDDANTLLEMIESAEGGSASHWRRRTLPPLKGAQLTVPPEALEPIRRQRSVARGVLDIAMPQVACSARVSMPSFASL